MYRMVWIPLILLVLVKGLFMVCLEEGPLQIPFLTKLVYAGQDPSQKNDLPAVEPGQAAAFSLMDKLRQEEADLQERQKQLALREEEVKKFEKELSERVKELKSERTEVEKIFNQILEKETERDTKLVKIYESMEPENAAKRIETLNEDMASWILFKMNPRQAGLIMGLLSLPKASSLSMALSKKSDLGKK